jgi:hypothetical protein
MYVCMYVCMYVQKEHQIINIPPEGVSELPELGCSSSAPLSRLLPRRCLGFAGARRATLSPRAESAADNGEPDTLLLPFPFCCWFADDDDGGDGAFLDFRLTIGELTGFLSVLVVGDESGCLMDVGGKLEVRPLGGRPA